VLSTGRNKFIIIIIIAMTRACEDLLHASTPPQVETARACELAKCRGNERWPPSPPDRRDRPRRSRGRSTTRRPVTAPFRYSLRQEWNLSLKKDKRILDTKTIRRAPALQSRAEPALQRPTRCSNADAPGARQDTSELELLWEYAGSARKA
jgi:hypothetical protein